jgi:YidC/Oxa1 family membrane protein insertase
MLVPFPIIIALYGAVRSPLTYIMELSRETIDAIAAVLNVEVGGGFGELTIANMLNDPENLRLAQGVAAETLRPVNFNFLGFNLAEVPTFAGLIVLIPLLSAFTSFLSVWLTQKFSGRPPVAGNAQTMMYLLGPGISLMIGFTWPAALAVYWTGQNLLQIPQEYFLAKHFNKTLDEEERVRAEREERSKAAEAAQKEEDRQRREERIAAQRQKKHKPKRYKLQNKPPEPDEGQEENEG